MQNRNTEQRLNDAQETVLSLTFSDFDLKFCVQNCLLGSKVSCLAMRQNLDSIKVQFGRMSTQIDMLRLLVNFGICSRSTFKILFAKIFSRNAKRNLPHFFLFGLATEKLSSLLFTPFWHLRQKPTKSKLKAINQPMYFIFVLRMFFHL